MNLEEKLRQLKNAAKKSGAEAELERQLDYLRRLNGGFKPLPAERVPCRIEEYVQGQTYRLPAGEYFMAEQALPLGRPYGNMRIGDIAASSLSSLDLFLEGNGLPEPERLVFLDTETTGLAGGTGTCAFLIGIGVIEGPQFVVRQYFLRDYTEETAVLTALAERLHAGAGLVTFNGKTFDVPLLETRYTLSRLRSPFRRMIHLDLLHPARRLWKLRLESCRLTNLESHVLGLEREGDVPGSEIPAIYFDYLRTGDARGLQPVFFHNALDIITLAALTVEMARVIERARNSDQLALPAALDLFSLSRIFERAGETALSASTCSLAIEKGLPEATQPEALWHLAVQHKRRLEFERAEEIWLELAELKEPIAVQAYRELAVYHEHRRRDAARALEFTERALALLSSAEAGDPRSMERFHHRRKRLQKRLGA
ncbi:MAG: ribonuclease H-like domain-containing protein [Terriglobia bacterium]